MRIVIAAVGRLKQGPERELAAEYCKRAEKVGRAFGLRDIEIVEIRESRAADRPAVSFVIGGADGLASNLRDRAKLKLAFGTATWPHQLVRVMLLEQLYRA